MTTEELILPQMQIIALFCALARKCGAGWEESASRSLAAKEYILQVTRSAHETSDSHHRSQGPLEYWDSDALHRDCELRPPSTQSMTRISAQKSSVTVFRSSFALTWVAPRGPQQCLRRARLRYISGNDLPMESSMLGGWTCLHPHEPGFVS
ncbi:hypothetical protein BGZ61DRAFT_554951 [Ilyonectria robusta]|uniref:uncharacterized protein n=1 Tax=Ilyonectria robusta TaxID=1079257 RepID=UPI001E8D4D58|nr:uncharacterized protein BGZ61DRAFT_554951 [Ilyonectria robusta]KAH8675049.1 hypothetical protein BGZ61DRAFT_554951 [Ilyonectria robusta]